MLLLWGLLSQFHLTKLGGSTAWLCSPLLLHRYSTYVLAGDCWGLFCPPPAVEICSYPPVRVLPAPSQDRDRLTDQCVAVVTPSSVAEDASPILSSSQSIAKVRTSIKFTLPTSFCAEILHSILRAQIWYQLVTHV